MCRLTLQKKEKGVCLFYVYEKANGVVNREALWQEMRMYDMGSISLSGIKIMYANILACVRVKGGDRVCFKIDSRVRRGCITLSWLFNVYMDSVMKEVKMGMGWTGVRFPEEGKEWILSNLSYVDDLV